MLTRCSTSSATACSLSGVRAYWKRLGDEFAPQADAVITVTPRLASALHERHRPRQLPAVLYNTCPFRPALPKTGKQARLPILSHTHDGVRDVL